MAPTLNYRTELMTKKSSLVERLRAEHDRIIVSIGHLLAPDQRVTFHSEAADEIETVQGELRKALEQVQSLCEQNELLTNQGDANADAIGALQNKVVQQHDEIERLEKHSRLGWNYAREVEDEYEKRMGHRFGSPQVELASSHQAVEQAISDSKNHKTKW